MNNIKILDCTLRDGGYINNWKFGQNSIKDIIKNLENANVDIIETGFLRPGNYEIDSSVFNTVEQIKNQIEPKNSKTLYAAMIENRNYPNLELPNYDGTSVDIIRITFRKSEWQEAKKNILDIMSKGYKVCVQPVGSASYDDQSLLNLIKDVNEIRPYAFYIVDTLGVMYRHDMRKFFYLIDNNLSMDINLGYHSHNNLQMAFANAQEMTRLSRSRKIILDSSCYGMGRGVGNLTTELIADYINNNIVQKYSLIPILNIVDKYLMPIYAEQRWGYDLPYFLSATAKCHPNYATYLIKKETLSIEKIEKVLSLIPLSERSEYNSKLIESIYLQMQDFEMDDSLFFENLKDKINGKKVLIIGSGASVLSHESVIKKKSQDCVIISVNFVPISHVVDFVFISNEKRLFAQDLTRVDNIIATSNLKDNLPNAMLFNYSSLLGEGDSLDNAGAMLIRILKMCKVKKILMAGFDGFDVDSSMNYAVPKFKKSVDYNTAKKKNEDISKQLKLALKGVDYEFITPTKYKISDI